MQKIMIAALALAAAACGQSTAPTQTDTAVAAPQSLIEQVQAMAAAEQPVRAVGLLQAYHAAHPDVTPPCTEIRMAESRGVVPADVAPGTVYSPYAGALVFAVQCGARLTTVRADPREHWLVVLAPGATDAVVVNCADARGDDACARTIPRAAPAAATTP